VFDLENLKALVQLAYVPKVISAFGSEGEAAIKALLDAVRLLFQRVPPEAMQGPLTVIRGIGTTPASPLIARWGRVERPAGHPELGSRLARAKAGNFMFVEVMADGSLGFVERDHDVDLVAAAAEGVIYRYEGRSDRILAKEHDVHVPKVSSILASVFCNPTLDSLSAALDRYAQFARETSCHILATAWEGGVDGPRLVLVNKPEATMRRSLAQALSLMLRDVSVRPEQNTDESKPVDIRVEWFASGASALIEIKWLGRSTAQQRQPKDHPTYTEYDDARARAGAKQLADYLDRQVRNSNATAPRGYLVVFDARRRNVDGPDDALSESDALFYESATIAYDPDYAAIRPDFETPVRFFLRPRRSHFKEAA
jgi:hypothetical protein